MLYTTKINICWHGAPCPDVYLEDLIKDISYLSEDLPSPSSLIFHTCQLTPDHNGPSISIWGEKGDDRFHCQYEETTEWVTLTPNKEDNES